MLEVLCELPRKEGAMTVGTKSILFRAHCFLIHGFFVARRWWTLWGFPWDPRLWAAFFVPDLGYLGWGDVRRDRGRRIRAPGREDHGPAFRRPIGRLLRHSRYMSQEAQCEGFKALLRRQASVRDDVWLVIPADGVRDR